MYHELPRTARFWWFLFAIDQDFANEIRKGGCSCGGRLHSADYLRSPHGFPDPVPDFLRIRLSFCCDRDGCRKRKTPPSVRFLGRKVYLGAIVILIARCDKGRHHAASVSFPLASASIGRPSLAGRSSGANNFRNHTSGRSRGPLQVNCRNYQPAILAPGRFPHPPSPL